LIEADANSASMTSVYYYAASDSGRVSLCSGCQWTVFTYQCGPGLVEKRHCCSWYD